MTSLQLGLTGYEGFYASYAPLQAKFLHQTAQGGQVHVEACCLQKRGVTPASFSSTKSPIALNCEVDDLSKVRRHSVRLSETQ